MLKFDITRLNNATPEDIRWLVNLTRRPYNSFQIAEALGVRIESDFDFDKMQTSGSIERYGDKYFTIWINPMDNTKRQNFTLAHELGHLVNDMFNDEKKISDNIDTIYKSNNNKFALELLMPESEIFADLLKITNSKQDITSTDLVHKMSDVYQVSKLAMGIRLEQLGVIAKNKHKGVK